MIWPPRIADPNAATSRRPEARSASGEGFSARWRRQGKGSRVSFWSGVPRIDRRPELRCQRLPDACRLAQVGLAACPNRSAQKATSARPIRRRCANSCSKRVQQRFRPCRPSTTRLAWRMRSPLGTHEHTLRAARASPGGFHALTVPNGAFNWRGAISPLVKTTR